MANRLVEVFAPTDRIEGVKTVLDAHVVSDVWVDRISEDRSIVRAVMDPGHTEEITDELTKAFADDESFRILLIPLEAMLPRREEETESAAASQAKAADSKRRLLFGRTVSREELFQDISGSIRSWPIFLTMTLLSVIVAAAGLARGNVAVIIGAMVIAPLLGPNIGLALATTLGDLRFGWRTMRFNLAGVSTALGCSILIGLVVPIDPQGSEMLSRTQVSFVDLLVAFASGVAGALAFTTGLSAAFIGVMVAVALVPPTVACGMLIGSGHWPAAAGAGLMLAINVTCINLAAIITFLVQGVRPISWWEKDRARKASRVAVLLWVLILAILFILLLIARDTGAFDGLDGNPPGGAMQKPGTPDS